MISSRFSNPWNSRLFRPSVGCTLYGWMVDRGSLTTRLRRHCPNFRVEVLYQGLGQPSQDERKLFHLRPKQVAWIREVLLCCGNTPLVFAHSVLPLPSARGAWNFFARMGNRPLGEALFTDPGISREPLRFLRLHPRHALRKRIGPLSKYPTLPARRSLFHRDGRNLLVTEVFLKKNALF
jgi:chorismate--pyruvate lyase